MPNKDGTANVGDAVKSIVIALIAALLIAWAGTSVNNSWLVILVAPIVTSLGALVATRKSGKQTSSATIIRWGLLGLVAGISWFAIS